jgi:hypothetical protein
MVSQIWDRLRAWLDSLPISFRPFLNGLNGAV